VILAYPLVPACPLTEKLRDFVPLCLAVAARALQSLDLTVNILNQLNPALDSTLSLTITGPDNYYHYDAR
jgi:hypothetical protein